MVGGMGVREREGGGWHYSGHVTLHGRARVPDNCKHSPLTEKKLNVPCVGVVKGRKRCIGRGNRE